MIFGNGNSFEKTERAALTPSPLGGEGGDEGSDLRQKFFPSPQPSPSRGKGLGLAKQNLFQNFTPTVRRSRYGRAVLSFFLLVLMAAAPIFAESPAAQKEMLRKIGFVQRLDTTIPLDLHFRNEEGESVALGDYFGKKPVILTLVYYRCPMLCTETLTGLVRSILPQHLQAGKDFNILTVSFDPKETPELARAKKEVYVARYGRSVGPKGWEFLTGDAASIHALTDAAGFHFAWDPEAKQYAHATGLVVLTPEGRISRYLYGVEFEPKDIWFALMDASAGKIGSPIDQLLLYCYHYDPLSGKYNLLIMRVMRLAGVGTVILLATAVLILLRQERRKTG